MANGASNAVALATRVSEVGFAEFTSKLVVDVFGAILDANIRQMAAYQALVQTVATSLADYASRTVSDADVDAFLANHAWWGPGREPTQQELDAFNAAVELPASSSIANGNHVTIEQDADTVLSNTDKTNIRTAARNRLGSRSYSLLQQMVRQGMLRLVVDSGVIETRLTFTTWGYTDSSKTTSQTTQGAGAGAAAGGGGSLFGVVGVLGAAAGLFGVGGAAAGGGGLAGVSVTTATTRDRDVTGSSVQIYGRVELRFKTDYVPLNP